MEANIERQIIIGLITNTEYCTKVVSILNLQFFQSATSKLLARWIKEYFDKYKKAPFKEIETIIYTKASNKKQNKSVIEEIEEDILPGLSKEYETQSYDLLLLIDETEKYFNSRHIQLHNEAVASLLDSGEVDEANRLMREFKTLEGTISKLDPHILSIAAIKHLERPRPKTLMSPWLREGELTLIYGNYGSGKSFLVMSIAYVLGLKDYTRREADIGKWQVKNPTGCLYVDGELGQDEIQDRMTQFRWIGPQAQEHKLMAFAVPEFQLDTGDNFFLSDRKNQNRILEWLKAHPTYKLIVLDSISTLFALKEENDNSEWNTKITPFLRDLRALKVACILLHHSGKDLRRGLRGASSMGAMAHNIFALWDHDGKEDGQAWFHLTKDKQRAGKASNFNDVHIKYVQKANGKQTHWVVNDEEASED